MREGILIKNGIVLTVNSGFDIYHPGYVLIDGDCITAVAEGAVPNDPSIKISKVIDANGCLVMPGMVNAHVHLFQTLLRGSAPDKDLLGWLFEVAFPLYEHMQPEDVYLGTLQGIVEAIRGGATAVIDNFTVRQETEGYDGVFKAAEESGIRYKMARGYSEIAYPASLVEQPEAIFENMEYLYRTWHGKHNGRLLLEFNPNVPWATTDQTMLRVGELALKWGIGIHLHTAESKAEVDQFIEKRGVRHVEWLEKLGILSPQCTLAHCVWISGTEIELIKKRGAKVTYNPICNMYVASGVAPVAEMLTAGIPVALGTDGQTCNNGQEIIDLAKWAINLQKVQHRDPNIMDSMVLMKMLCNYGAQAFGQPDRIGSLEVGKRADIVIVDYLNSRLCSPAQDVISSFVNYACSSDVITVIVDGRILMEDRKITFLDEEALSRGWNTAKKALWQRAHVKHI